MSGVNLKINAAEEDKGVFRTKTRGETTKTTVVIQSSNISLQLQIPELRPGTYTVALRIVDD